MDRPHDDDDDGSKDSVDVGTNKRTDGQRTLLIALPFRLTRSINIILYLFHRRCTKTDHMLHWCDANTAFPPAVVSAV